VRNLLNDSTKIAWNTNVSPDFDGPVDEHGIPTQYIEGPNFGEANAPEDYITPREYLFSVGIRF